MPINNIIRGTAGNPNDRFKIGDSLMTAQQNDEYLDAAKATVVETFAALATTAAPVAGMIVYSKQHTSGGLGGGYFQDNAGTITNDGGTLINNTVTSGRHWKAINYDYVTPEMFGFIPGISGDAAANTTALNNCIASLRKNPVSIQQNAGGGAPIITAYSSGKVKFGNDIYVVSPGISIEYDLGLMLEGVGSRGSNNSIIGPTTLLFKGSSSDYGIRSYGNGGRFLQLKDMDICYLDAGFTGDVIDNYDAVGLKITGCYVGTFGVGTVDYPRRLTARSCLRQTYDEFTHIVNSVFSGAIDGWYDDASRTIDSSTFGGSLSKWDTVTFYDFTGNMMLSPSTRTRETMTVVNCAFNPITQDCSRSLYLQNVVNLNIQGSFFTPSTVNKPTVEWATILNCHGKVQAEYGGLAKAGTFSGSLDLSSSTFGGTDGVTLKSGAIFSRSCKFVDGTNGWLISPDDTLHVDIGEDIFSADITSSYYLPTDSANVRGRVSYSAENDNSTSKFEINSARVRLENQDQSILTLSDTTLSMSFVQSGRTHTATASANQTWELPAPRFCTTFPICKFSDSAYTLQINAPAGKNFMVGQAATKTGASSTSVGAYIEFEALNADTYICKSIVGSWTFT